jgi:hypothetical protein
VGRELRAATLGETAASVRQPVSAVGAVHPGGQATGCGCRRGPSVGCGDTPDAGRELFDAECGWICKARSAALLASVKTMSAGRLSPRVVRTTR